MMVATATPPIGSENTTSAPPSAALDDAASVQDRRIRELEERFEHQAIRRDSATVLVCAMAAFALLASIFAVGFGMRAMSDSKHNGSAVATTVAGVAVTPPHASLSEFKVGLSATTFAPGPLAITISNNGTLPHELLVFRSELDVAAYPVDADGNIIEDSPAVALVSDGENIDPGGSQDRTIDLTVPGKYVFVCNISGHFKAGMFTQVTVA